MGGVTNSDPNNADSLTENVDDFKLLELNKWADGDGLSYSAHGYDVYVQRLSLYIQRNMEGADLWDSSPRGSINLDDASDAASVSEPDITRKGMDCPSENYDNGKQNNNV
jgi:hypothetical protein